jgi:hypothetical protein
MKNKIFKRIVSFLAVLFLSFFIPWQITAFILMAMAILVEIPIEYTFIVIGIFGASVFSIFWGILCLLGVFIREKTFLNTSFL